MRGAHSPATGDPRRLPATLVAGLLAVAGLTCIGVAVSHQHHSAQPPLTNVGSPGPPKGQAASGSARQSAPSRATSVVGPVLKASLPVSIVIPAIGVRSPLLHVGLTSDGSLEVPTPGPTYDDAGWYRYSPTPGSLGPAVIVGHVDSAAHGPSVFYRLGSLRPRDTVRIKRADGSVAVFAVDDVRRYQKSRFPTQLVYGNTNHAALRLITCGGPFGPTGHYRDNIVVLASLTRGQPTVSNR
ncbi:MAG: class F sortase [Actinomycetes bacterium]